MAKGKFNMAGMGGMNMNALMKQAQKMQEKMQTQQAEMQSKEFEASAGGGAVNVKVSGAKVITKITIDKDAVDPDDVEMLEDMITAAANEALRKVDEANAAMLGDMGVNGLL